MINKSICVLSHALVVTDFVKQSTFENKIQQGDGAIIVPKYTDAVERVVSFSIQVKYYNRREIKTHPERKNMAASVFFLKRALCAEAAPRPGLIWLSGEDVVSAGRLC